MSYSRVLPRDLFNEGKLLKCLGRLTLLIHDDMAIPGLTFDHDGDPFRIHLADEGSLLVSNIRFRFKETPLIFKTTYNSKASYPLYCEWDYVDYLVFNESGEFENDFIELLNNL